MKNKLIEGMIGLEIHAYLVTKEKLFCQCIASRERGVQSNINICAICTGQPGAKPMLPNKTAVEKAVQIGIMLGCKINNQLTWQRKHYNWPDLPKGYQNTLSGPYAIPVGEKGSFQGINISNTIINRHICFLVFFLKHNSFCEYVDIYFFDKWL